MSTRRKKTLAGDELRSLLAEAVSQIELFEVVPHAVEAEALATKQCTAELLFKRAPGDYAEVVKALASSMPIREIKKRWGIGTQTVYAVLKRERVEVGTLKKRIAETLFVGALAGAERVSELVGDCGDPVAAAMAMKMMAETGNLMNGQATQISEHRVIVVDATSALERLRKKAAEMGLETGEKSAMRDVSPVASGAPGLPDSGRGLPGIGAALDAQSAVIDAQSLDNQGDGGACHTPRHSDGDPDQNSDGGGGGRTRGEPGASQ